MSNTGVDDDNCIKVKEDDGKKRCSTVRSDKSTDDTDEEKKKEDDWDKNKVDNFFKNFHYQKLDEELNFQVTEKLKMTKTI